LRRYSYWGDRRAVVVQFSRECPHQCNYCGQRPFWRRWRHRNPQKFAAELAWLHRIHGVEVIDFADENPTLRTIHKGTTTAQDREAIRLLRENGILSMATYVIGFEEETDKDYWHSLRQLLSYDPDQIQLLYVTPHRPASVVLLDAELPFPEPASKGWPHTGRILEHDLRHGTGRPKQPVRTPGWTSAVVP
jgi:anaerobic magnesium-protoporphyrin IX monomethyl ester cyclase